MKIPNSKIQYNVGILGFKNWNFIQNWNLKNRKYAVLFI